MASQQITLLSGRFPDNPSDKQISSPFCTASSRLSYALYPSVSFPYPVTNLHPFGRSTWTLPESWGNVTEVTIYKLSAEGKSDKKTLPVTGRKVTIDATAKTAYVLYKEDAVKVDTADTME